MSTDLGVATGRRRCLLCAGMSVLAVLMSILAAIAPATARPKADSIVLPDASSAEGIAIGRGATFYAGDLFAGDIFRGDLQKGTAEPFINAPAGRMAVGMAFHRPSGLLFVAGGFTGQAYVYDTRTRATVAVYNLGAPDLSLINDVTITKSGAWFTDSMQPRLYFVPIAQQGDLGPSSTLDLSGPAAALVGFPNLNGIAATPDGSTLIVAHSANAALYTVDPDTGASSLISGVSVPNVDGIVFEAGRLWAVQNTVTASPPFGQVSVVDLAPDLTQGVLVEVIISNLFETPSTAARHGSRLAVVNAKFHTGIPPTADDYNVVVVDG
jgi:sugar lactone lactonase YvrE